MEFAPGPAMQTRRARIAAARLDVAGAPRILVVGGYTADGSGLSTTELLAISDEATA
jgi:hypothetical protein